MKTKGLSLLLVLALALGIVGVAHATFPITTVITADAIIVAPGQMVNLTATTNTEGNSWFNEDKWTTSGGTLSAIVPASGGPAKTFVSTAKLTSPVEGSFTVRYWIELRAGNSTSSATSDDADEIVIQFVQQQVIFECPAAPAIAARLLRANGVSGRDHGKFVSMVAHEMGSDPGDANGSWFWGIDKCVVVNGVATANPAYEAAVNQFLMNAGAY